MIFVTVVINYLDRTNMSIAASALKQELGIDAIQMGYIFSAFGWTYSLLQIPGGLVADRVKSRILYPILMLLWSIATLLQGLVSSLAALIGLRAGIGIFEAPSYPINNLVVTRWFPENERASAIATYTSGQFLGMAVLLPVLALIQDALGWRGLFIVSGGIGLAWALVWYLFYRDPQDHGQVSEEELNLIREGGGIVTQTNGSKTPKTMDWSNLHLAFRYRKLWGLYLGQFCLGGTTIFFLTWFPTYLVDYRGLDFIKSGFYASVPYLAAFAGVLLAGFTSDYLVKRGYSPEVSRKTPIVTGMLLSTAIIGANYTDNTSLIIFFLSLAFFGTGLASIAWVFISLIAPKEHLGLIGGTFNFIGGLSGIVVPIAIGFLVQDGDFAPALYFIGAMALFGLVCYTVIVGKVVRIVPPKRNTP